MKRANCKSCGAEIVWAVTSSGRRIPVDYQGESVVILTEAGDEVRASVRLGHKSHFATCPNAAKHRSAG